MYSKIFLYKTSDGLGKLFLVFTLRGEKVRIISARDMSKRERNLYEKNKKTLPEFRTEEEERKFWETHDFTDYLESFQPANLDL